MRGGGEYTRFDFFDCCICKYSGLFLKSFQLFIIFDIFAFNISLDCFIDHLKIILSIHRQHTVWQKMFWVFWQRESFYYKSNFVLASINLIVLYFLHYLILRGTPPMNSFQLPFVTLDDTILYDQPIRGFFC